MKKKTNEIRARQNAIKSGLDPSTITSVRNLSLKQGQDADLFNTHPAIHNYGKIDPAYARELFIRHALVYGEWQPRPGPLHESRRAAAHAEAKTALTAYWSAMEGTLDPKKVAEATDNAVVGNADDVAEQIAARFHPEDRLMLWFDFFNHNCDRIIANQDAFMEKVAPRVAALQGGAA